MTDHATAEAQHTACRHRAHATLLTRLERDEFTDTMTALKNLGHVRLHALMMRHLECMSDCLTDATQERDRLYKNVGQLLFAVVCAAVVGFCIGLAIP